MSRGSELQSSVEYCRIHPGIGIGRLGNSIEEYFIGPEVPESPPTPEGNLFKDRHGRVKRQAVRFHIYAYDSNDKVLKELTSDDCSISWNVHLANRKGEAKLFVGKFNQTDNVPNRNSHAPNRNDLVIDPGLRSISGINQKGDNYKFNTGKFLGRTVPLGEIQTDEKGRLIVLGGFGKSDSIDINKFPIRQFANNDGWFDDTSDGPVTASVTLNNNNGKSIPIKETAWVIIAPPKFSPYHYPILTLYDTMKEVALEQKWITKPKEVSFMRDIFPLFFRVIQYKWLNETVERGHGPDNILTKFKELSANTPDSANLRKMIFERVRNPNLIDNPFSAEAIRQAEPFYMPILSGDDGEWDNGKFRTFMTILPSQYDNLKRWSEGDFISDFDDSQINNPFEQRKLLEELPIETQPNALDKSTLEPSIGGPFFPGIEITYIARDPSLYNGKPFRINPNLKPGHITKYMAVPWQADFLLCRDYWWPTARPDDVVVLEGVNGENVDKRKKWARGSDGKVFLEDYLQMVNEWSTLGFIKPKKVGNETFFIESERS